MEENPRTGKWIGFGNRNSEYFGPPKGVFQPNVDGIVGQNAHRFLKPVRNSFSPSNPNSRPQRFCLEGSNIFGVLWVMGNCEKVGNGIMYLLLKTD